MSAPTKSANQMDSGIDREIEGILETLNPAARAALQRANGLRKRRGQPAIHMEHLIVGLYDESDGLTEDLIRSAGINRTELYGLLDRAVDTSLPKNYQPSLLTPPPGVSKHVRAALVGASESARDAQSTLVSSRHLLLGALSVSKCTVVKALQKEGVNRSHLEPLESSVTAKAASVAMASDRPITKVANDKFKYRQYAEALFSLIDEEKTDTPLTLAINARWGVGKTSLGRLVQELLQGPRLHGNPPHAVCWFNAWMHDEAENLTPGLVSAVALAADRHRPWWRRVVFPIPIHLIPRHKRLSRRVRRVAMWSIILSFATLAVFWISGRLGFSTAHGFFDPVTRLVTWVRGTPRPIELTGLGVGLTLLTALAKATDTLLGAARSVGSFVADPSHATERGSLSHVRAQLGELIEEACLGGRRRFVVFIDDLERCRPPRAVDVLEATNQLLGHKGVVTIVMADMPAVVANVRMKYGNLAEQYNPTRRGGDKEAAAQAYGRFYLQKIVQLQFDLPEPREKVQKLLRASVGTKGRVVEQGEDPVERRRLLPEEARRMFDFARKPPTRLRHSFVDAQQRWQERSFVTRSFLLAGWTLSIPALTAGAIAMAMLRGGREAEPGPRTSAVAGTLGMATAVWPFLGVAWWALPTTSPVNEVIVMAAAYFGLAGLTGVVVAAGVTWSRWCTWRAMRRTSDGLDEGKPVEQMESSADKEMVEALSRQHALGQLANDSDLLRVASSFAENYLPAIPRNLNRFNNRLRLLLFIADRRGMLKRESEEVAKHLGKWAVLQEVWPEIAQHVAGAPGDLVALEEAPDNPPAADARPAQPAPDARGDVKPTRGDILERIAPQYAADEDLRAFLSTAPQLGAELARLVQFRPLRLVDQAAG